MNLKKITALMIGAVMAVSMAVPAMADDKVETVTDGKLTVATSPDFAPYEFYSIDEDGNPTLAGFDMDLAKYIADKMGLELEVVPMDFDGVLSELSQKNVDLGMAGLSPDPARADAMEFSDLYYKGGQSFVTVKDKADKFTKLEDANNKDYSIGAQTGSIQLDLANENTPDADIVSLPKVTDIITELLTGKMDGAFIETAVAESYQKNYPDLEIVCDVPYDTEGSAIGVAKGNEALLKAVNEAIADAIDDGSMDKFVADATELAAGQTYEGTLDENGAVPEADDAEYLRDSFDREIFLTENVSGNTKKITDSSPFLQGEELLLFMYVRFSAIIHKN